MAIIQIFANDKIFMVVCLRILCTSNATATKSLRNILLMYTMRAGILSPKLVKSRSREIGCYNNRSEISVELLPRCLLNFKPIEKFKPESRDFETSCGKLSICLENRGPGIHCVLFCCSCIFSFCGFMWYIYLQYTWRVLTLSSEGVWIWGRDMDKIGHFQFQGSHNKAQAVFIAMRHAAITTRFTKDLIISVKYWGDLFIATWCYKLFQCVIADSIYR